MHTLRRASIQRLLVWLLWKVQRGPVLGVEKKWRRQQIFDFTICPHTYKAKHVAHRESERWHHAIKLWHDNKGRASGFFVCCVCGCERVQVRVLPLEMPWLTHIWGKMRFQTTTVLIDTLPERQMKCRRTKRRTTGWNISRVGSRGCPWWEQDETLGGRWQDIKDSAQRKHNEDISSDKYNMKWNDRFWWLIAVTQHNLHSDHSPSALPHGLYSREKNTIFRCQTEVLSRFYNSEWDFSHGWCSHSL